MGGGRWYQRRRGEEREWKTQSGKAEASAAVPAATETEEGEGNVRGVCPRSICVRANPSDAGRYSVARGVRHVNLVVSSLFAGATCEAYLAGGDAFGFGSTLVALRCGAFAMLSALYWR